MTPQENEVITGIFDRLKQVKNQPRDPEAEKLIGDLVTKQPYAPYAMAQAMFVQEQALKQYSERVRDLEARLAENRPAPAQTGSFLGGLFGGGKSPEPAASAPPPQPHTSVPQTGPASAPQYGAPPPQAQPMQAAPGAWGGGSGGGFLHSAMSTAAGVAGGALLFQGLRSMFGGHSGFGGGFGGAGFGGAGFADPGNTTIINEYGTPPDAGSDAPTSADFTPDDNANLINASDTGQDDNTDYSDDGDSGDDGGDFSDDSGGDDGGDWT